MTPIEAVGAIASAFAVLGTAISAGIWIGLRRAETKRLVRVEDAINRLKQEMTDYKDELNKEIKGLIRDSDETYARKDLIDARLESMREKQLEIAEDIKYIKKKLESRQ